MESRNRINWLIFIVLTFFAIVLLELNKIIPASLTMHHIVVIMAGLFILFAGATYVYEHARRNSQKSAWWQDDDWTHWGGI